MIGWVLLGVYVVGYLVTMRRVFARMVEGDRDRWVYQQTDWEDVVLHLVMAWCIAFVWPIALPITVAQDHMNPEDFVRRVGGETVGAKSKRLEQERAEREEYIADLERQLEIGPYAQGTAA